MMARTLELTVLTPAETLLEVGAAAWVHLRLVDGTGITIYPGHAPLLAETVTAALQYADEDGEHVFNAEAGILQVEEGQVVVLTSGETAGERMPRPPTTSEERRFERLAQELRAKLEREPESALRGVLTSDHG
jgi:F0F1-type ATP synthase epsilon subunit